MPAKLSHEEFIRKLENINSNIIILSEYHGRDKKVKCKCKKCNNEWESTPDALYAGHGCAKCAGVKLITHEEFVERIAKINPSIEVLGRYINKKTKIKVRCKKHNHVWDACPDSIMRGSGCVECRREKTGNYKRKSNEKFITDLEIKNPFVIALEEYPTNNKTKIKFKCKKCGNVWEAAPDTILNAKHGCPVCVMSHGEKVIATYLSINGIYFIQEYKFKDCKDKRCLRFDFYIPQINMCIEFDGMQHYCLSDFGLLKGEIEKQAYLKEIQRRDQIKTDYCKEHNIRLLRIPYTEYKNINKILDETFKELSSDLLTG